MICDGGSSVVRVPRLQRSLRTARSRTISIETATYFWSFATMVTHFTDSLASLTLEGLEESSHLDNLSSAYLGRHAACSRRALLDYSPTQVRQSTDFPWLRISTFLTCHLCGYSYDGWLTVSSELWIQLSLLVVPTGIMAAANCFTFIGSV